MQKEMGTPKSGEANHIPDSKNWQEEVVESENSR